MPRSNFELPSFRKTSSEGASTFSGTDVSSDTSGIFAVRLGGLVQDAMSKHFRFGGGAFAIAIPTAPERGNYSNQCWTDMIRIDL